ncbi:hypothetical protein BD560DRAFT_196969 [Blakeslea trispora]|nr:hypothetical protein BD560DRAFT_196969 [Blakeslea trispora]
MHTSQREIDTSLGFMAGRYYVLEKFDIKTKESIKAIADDIKQVLLDSFHQLEWLDEKTRRNAERKLNKLTVKIGYSESSPDVMSPVSLSSYYGAFIIKPDDYFSNYVNGRISTVSNAWRQVGKPIDKGVWWMYPHEVDAYSRSAFNEIGIPAGILQGLYFEESRPEYLNYGAIGSVLGHEMTHGYDSRGRRYDADGKLFQWWTEHTAKEYEVKADCFVKQYNNFTVTDEKGQPVNVNGKFTLAENLADNGGVKKAVEAWKSRYLKDPSSKQHNNMRLPGLNALSPEQLFFISFARTYCKNITPAQAKKKVLTDNHAPYKWRINAPLQNSFEFAEAFRCPAGSPMNPVKKCSLW